MDKIIKIENLHFTYPGDEIPTLCGIDLEIERGSFVAVLGHNGSGKSTLAKLLNAILLPSDGKVTVSGIDTADKERTLELRRTVGLVFQNPDNQIVANLVEDDVAFAPENLGVEPEEIRRRVDDALKTVGMYEYRMHAPHLLSGGQKQRVAIAGILAMQPDCIVLDEPTAMLDPIGRREVVSTVSRLCREKGITVLLITHHMSECVDADRLIVLSEGKVVADGVPSDVFADADLLWSEGLSVPATTKLLYELNKSGINVPLTAIKTDDCATAVVNALNLVK
ncbi:MAG: energy-coupling factor transporter ATPase [Ruminococcaceae bacterium]|nr:energy-coupling factor transporter ATPase [Oscillospiraceae bacterium]